ncbi:MAG: DUF429 domain-containing protein [Alphaproteobacteria bacterium]
MSVAAGVDGCKGGWVMVRRYVERGTADFMIFQRWRDLPSTDMVAIDMPIGLPESGPRGCDKLARRMLGPRGASVFLGLRRPLLDFETYDRARLWAREDGFGLSKQAWYLLPKIRELDEAVSPGDQARIREAHPELAFLALQGSPLEHSKKSPEGLKTRMDLLRENGFGRITNWVEILDTGHASADDLLDACALALSAERMLKNKGQRLPADEPPRDAKGLRMEIWY